MRDINLNSEMNLYICSKCNIVHTKGSNIQKLHSKFRKKDLVKRYYCSKCETFHNRNTMIHLKHYDFRNLKELTPGELFNFSFKKSWKREANRQKKLPKQIDYSNPNKLRKFKNQMNSFYGKFSEIEKNQKTDLSLLNYEINDFLNNINLFLETNIDFFLLFSKYSELERKFKEIWQNKYISNFGKYGYIKNYLEDLNYE